MLSLQRPVVVTCRDESGISLSSHLNLLRLSMQHSSPAVLLEQLILVSVCEGVQTSLAWLQQLAKMSRNDLR